MIDISDIFLLVMVLGNLYFLTASRQFDSFSLAFFSLNFYLLPAFFGYVMYPVGGKLNVVREIVPTAYFVFLSLPISILIFSKLYDVVGPRVRHFPKLPTANNQVRSPVYLQICFLLAVVFSFLGYFSGGSALFSGEKAEVLGAEGRSYLMGIYFCLLSAVYAYQAERKKILLCVVFLLLLNFYVGHRSNMAILILSLVLLKIGGKGPSPVIVNNKRIVVTLCFIALIFFGYKWFYIGIKTGDFDLIGQRLSDPRLLVLIFGESEPFFTQSILNEVISTNFSVSITQYGYSFLVLFPFMDGFIESSLVSFNDVFQPQLFGSIDYGIAANLWAQGWAAGGLLGFVLVALFYNSVLWTLNVMMRTKNQLLRTLVVLSTAYWAFYAHRSDFVQMLSVEKRLLYSGVMILIIAFFVKRSVQRKTRIL